MGGDNTIYRPDPAKGEFNSNEIPVWDESFYNDYASQWVLRVAYDPKGEDLPTLGEQRECDSGTCEDLSADELKKLWQVYGSKFDGVFKRENGSYYFFRNPINETPANPAICREGANLKTSLTRTEADVLELWTSFSEHDLARCETATTGEGSYKAVLKDKTDYEKVKGELNALIQALEWEKANPGQAENPHNPRKLPLAIPLKKVVALKGQFTLKEHSSLDKLKEFFSDPVNLLLTGLSLLAAGYLTGLGFAIAGRQVGHGTPKDPKKTEKKKGKNDGGDDDNPKPQGGDKGSKTSNLQVANQNEGVVERSILSETPAPFASEVLTPIPTHQYVWQYMTEIDGQVYAMDPMATVQNPMLAMADGESFTAEEFEALTGIAPAFGMQTSAVNVFAAEPKPRISRISQFSLSSNKSGYVEEPTVNEVAARAEQEGGFEGDASSVPGTGPGFKGSPARVRLPVRGTVLAVP